MPTRDQERTEQRKAKRDALRAIKLERGCEALLDDGSVCGYNRHPDALHWDHVEEKTHLYRTAYHINWSWDRIMAELEKCEVVCACCHAIRTAERGYYDPKAGSTLNRSPLTSRRLPGEPVQRPDGVDATRCPNGHPYDSVVARKGELRRCYICSPGV